MTADHRRRVAAVAAAVVVVVVVEVAAAVVVVAEVPTVRLKSRDPRASNTRNTAPSR